MSTRSAVQRAERILQRCDELAQLSEDKGRLTRVYLSEQQSKASALVCDWMAQAGMSTRVDPIGNVIGRLEGREPGLPCLMVGSHLDTVRDAGKYDGALGVITAVDCVASISARQRNLPFAIEVVGFADEEGVRFGTTLLGSRAVAGSFDFSALEKTDAAGTALRDAMLRFGLNPETIGCAARARDTVLAYAELHIEQGPVLEQRDLPVGVVTSINGASRLLVDVRGFAGHAGTVPMDMRRDALTAAGQCILEVEHTCKSASNVVGTVGQLHVSPGAINVIPQHVRFSIDIRAADDVDRIRAVRRVEERLKQICSNRHVDVSITRIHENASAACAPWLIDQISSAIAAEGLAVQALPSGAGHDGMAMISLTDIGMLFVRCLGGISHSPFEAVALEDVATGACIFERFIENFSPVGK